MKLGVFYTVFNGTELLEGALRNILPHVDVVLLHYQNTSNRGHKSHEFREWFENRETLSDKIHTLRYKPLTNWSQTKENETRKHNIAIDFLRSKSCTHFLMSACDHYYNPHEFEAYKEEASHYDITWTSMYTYYKKPTWQLTPMETYYMPFICKLYPNTKICTKFPVLVDPACGIWPYKSTRQFESNELILHHYSMVRKDIRNKFINAAANINWKDRVEKFAKEYENYDIKSNPGVSYFQGRKIKEVPNWFNI